MTLFFLIAFPVLAVCVVTCLYPEAVTKLFAGNGKRRKQSPAELLADNQRLKRELAEAKKTNPCENCGHVTGWPTNAQVADSDRSDPAPHIHAPAPVDNGSRDTPLAAAETARDMSLAAMALPGEEEMAAELDTIRATVRAKAEADTQQLHLPKIPDRAPEPNPLDIPAPHPMASATSIPVTAVNNAVTNIQAVMSEAS